jgi:hypothetical protein
VRGLSSLRRRTLRVRFQLRRRRLAPGPSETGVREETKELTFGLIIGSLGALGLIGLLGGDVWI